MTDVPADVPVATQEVKLTKQQYIGTLNGTGTILNTRQRRQR